MLFKVLWPVFVGYRKSQSHIIGSFHVPIQVLWSLYSVQDIVLHRTLLEYHRHIPLNHDMHLLYLLDPNNIYGNPQCDNFLCHHNPGHDSAMYITLAANML